MSHSSNELIESDIRPYAQDWEDPKASEDRYSTNQMIAAYKVGIAKGIDKAQALVQEAFTKNYNKSGADTAKLIKKTQEYGFHPISARLKVIAWDEFEVLLTLAESEFVDERLEIVYDFIGDFENTVREKHYCVSFHLCPKSEGYDEQKVKSDGFSILHKLLDKK